MVRYVRRFGHLWLVQRHPKPSLADVVGLVTISIELWHVGQLHTSGTTKQSPEKSGRVRRLNISVYVY